MNYALIGCGRIAINHMIAANANGLNIVSCCDVVPKQIETLINKCKFNTDSIGRYTDYKKMVQENRLDLVAIATESGKHSEIALYCIEHGINVIIEKPIAMSIDDANRIVTRAKENKVKVGVCHQNRFNDAVVAAKRAILDGRLGKLSHASICVRWNRDKNYYDQAPWRGTWEQDGGTLMNQCIHGIDLLLYLVGSPAVSVYGQTRQQFHPYLAAEDVGMGLVSFENGAIGAIEGTVNVFPKNLEETLYLFGERGTVKIGGTSTNKIDFWEFSDKREDDSSIRDINETASNVYGNGHTKLYSDVINAIANGREPLVNGEEGEKALEIVLSIYKSQKTGERIVLPLQNFSSVDMKGTF
jgi:UDP-N-acetyl-2-amino-2-deoxyglucuronate dehydrogenase